MTQNQIPGVRITVMDTKTGAISKTDGTYAVKGLQKGIYSVRFSAIGFQTYIQSNIMVTNVNPVQLDIELIDKVIELKGVEVRSSYFTKNIETVTSTQTLNSEDVKRAPGVQEMS
ncbi:MAG: hypothetical protein QG635_2465 [Bacteroidota bacterium]|nr:hypothetical protein [Bacteroidota bacterium]